MNPNESAAAWALQFAGTLAGVLCILSGMSTLEQMQQNIETFRTLDPLTTEQMHRLETDIAEQYRNAGPLGGDMSAYEEKTLHGVPVGTILEGYSVCQIQPNPGFADDNNYLKNMAAENAHIDIFGELPREKVIPDDGTDVTDKVLKAEDWLIKHSF